SLAYDSDYWSIIYNPTYDSENVRPGARLIAANTGPDDMLIVFGNGYDPSWLYTAQRTGLTLTTENFEATLPTIRTDRYRTLYSLYPWDDPTWITRMWRWTGARDAGIYRMSDHPSGVADAALIATDEPSAIPGDAVTIADGPLRIPCDFNGADIPVGRRGTVLQFQTGYARTARIELGHVSGPIPVRSVVYLPSASIAGVASVRATCAGTAELVIDRVLDTSVDLR